MALMTLGTAKNFNSMKANWLPAKTIMEIRHRIKNLTCQRAPENVIKTWKKQHCIPLRQGWISKDGINEKTEDEDEEQDDID